MLHSDIETYIERILVKRDSAFKTHPEALQEAVPALSALHCGGQQAEASKQRKDVSRETMEQLETYVRLLLQWNSKINLIGPSTESEVWERHILDSLQLAAYIPPHHRVLDLGSGAGLPGVPLAILGYDVTMVESDMRKSIFIQEALRGCGVGARARVINARIEALPKGGNYDTICARALAPLSALCAHAYPQLAQNAQCLFPKGERYRIELEEMQAEWSCYPQEHSSLSNSQSVILQLFDLRPSTS